MTLGDSADADVNFTGPQSGFVGFFKVNLLIMMTSLLMFSDFGSVNFCYQIQLLQYSLLFNLSLPKKMRRENGKRERERGDYVMCVMCVLNEFSQ